MFLFTYFKHLFIIFCATYIYVRVLNTPSGITLKRLPILSASVIVLPAITYFLRLYLRPASLIVTVCVSVLLFRITYKTEFRSGIQAVLLGYGISYLTYTLCALFCATIWAFFLRDYIDYSSPIFSVVVGVFQLVLIFFLFRIKRLKNGISFLHNVAYSDLGIYLCITILFIESYFSTQREDNLFVGYTLVLCVLLCGITLWLWWQDRTKREYAERLRQKEATELKDKITEQSEQIKKMESEVEELSKIVHKDNKLIPALDLSVKEFLLTTAQCDNRQERIVAARKMLSRLEQASQERLGIIKSYELTKWELPTTGNAEIDALLAYMQQKANASGVDFSVSVDGDISATMTCSGISQQDISSMLADLIENALLAVTPCKQRHIFTLLSVQSGNLYVSISDSGVPFPPEVIRNWGIRRVTTRQDNGGNGIGMINVYEICTRYHASFSLEVFEPEMYYSKRISVCFDNGSQFDVLPSIAAVAQQNGEAINL